MRPQPLIAVLDVEASSRWYQRLLDCKSGHGGRSYDVLMSGKDVLLQLHAFGDPRNEHEHLGDPASKPYGNGVVLWFQTDGFDAAVSRARELDVEILEEPHVNPNAKHREIWLRDPDGYVVVLAGARGDV
jgi:catechol 2,3-dioxygenase-like lactoylglutathione lyase family enzyme